VGVTTLAPIVLFVFNRADHTRKTLGSLRNNTLASNSHLIIYSDGPRRESDIEPISEVRKVLDTLDGFASITRIDRAENPGLTANIVSGVTEVMAQYGTVIAVEDDLISSPYFLEYMNNGLRTYQTQSNIFSISGYGPPINIPRHYTDPVYWAPRSSSWGWASWQDRWAKVNWSVPEFKEFITDPIAISRYNQGGNDLTDLLVQQMTGKLDTWDVQWCFYHYLNDAGCVYPTHSLIHNIGTDGTGTNFTQHTTKYSIASLNTAPPRPLPPVLRPHPQLLDRFKAFNDMSTWAWLKRFIWKLVKRLPFTTQAS